MYSYLIYECCAKCEFPDFSLCALAGYPDWQCGSEAYDCVFSCRDEDSVLEAVVEASGLGLNRKRELNITDSEVRCMLNIFNSFGNCVFSYNIHNQKRTSRYKSVDTLINRDFAKK